MTGHGGPPLAAAPTIQRQLAARFRELREGRGLSRQQLARLIFCSGSMVEKIKRSERVPRATLITRCEQVFATGGILLELLAELEDERAASRRHTTDHRSPARSRQQRETGNPKPPPTEHRQTRPAITTPAPATAIATAASDQVRLALDALLDDATCGHSRLDRLEAQTDQHARDALVVAPADMFDRLLLTMRDAGHLGATVHVNKRRLHAMIARLAALAAEQLTVLGQPGQARAWHHTAVTAADASGSHRLRADVRATTALLPLRLGHPGEAIRIAGQALDLAGSRTCLTTVLGPAIQAIGLAQLGRPDAARTAFARAQHGYAQLDGPLRAESVFGFAPRRLLLFEGHLLTRLAEYEPAWAAHRQALALYPEEVVADRVTICLDRATALIGTGRIADGAELVAATLITIPAEHQGRLYLHTAAAVLADVPTRAQRLPAVRSCHQILAELDQPPAGLAQPLRSAGTH